MLSSMQRRMSTREKIFLLIFAVALVAALYVVLIVFGVGNSKAEAQARLTELEDEIVTQSAITQVRLLAQVQVEAFQIFADVMAPLPDYNNEKALMDALNLALRASDDYYVQFRDVVKAEDSPLVVRGVTIMFYVNGYDQARGIIQALLDGPFRCEITQLKIAPKDGKAASMANVPLTVNLTMEYCEWDPNYVPPVVEEPAETDETAE